MSIVRSLRQPWLRPLWGHVHRASLIGLNYWASAFAETGERAALQFVKDRLDPTTESIIFDVGANVGEFSTACLALFGKKCRIHAFEPSEATFRLLEDKIGRYANVEAHRIGFSDHARDADLYSSEPGSSIASVHKLGRPIRPFRDELTERVRLQTLDDFCAETGIERIDFLKLDIEGHELMALRGARRMIEANVVRFIQFEFGENNVSSRTYLADFIDMLGDRYRFYQVVPGGPVEWEYAGGRSEVFATMNYLCERRQ